MSIFAAVGDTPYNIMLFLHILSAMAAFAPTFVHPLVTRQTRDLDAGARSFVFGQLARNGRTVYAPALIISGVLGFGLSGMSDDVYSLSDGWLIAAVVVWIAMNGILHALVLASEKALAAGDRSAEGRLSQANAALSVLLVIMLFLMVFKPGA